MRDNSVQHPLREAISIACGTYLFGTLNTNCIAGKTAESSGLIMRKRVMNVVMACVLVFTVAACGSNSDSSSDAETTVEKEEVEEETKEEEIEEDETEEEEDLTEISTETEETAESEEGTEGVEEVPETSSSLSLTQDEAAQYSVCLAVGSRHIVGLKTDGTVVAIGGENTVDYGECDVEEWSDIIAVSSGFMHTVGLKADGTVVATGMNNYGECDVQDWTDIVAIAAANFQTYGLKSDGTVVAVGDISDEATMQRSLDKLTGIVSIYSNADLNCVETIDGNGELSYASGAWGTIQKLISEGHFSGMVSVAGYMMLQEDGSVLSLDGGDDYSDWSNIVAVDADDYGDYGLRSDGTVVSFKRKSNSHSEVSGFTDIVAIDAGYECVAGLRSDGTVVVFCTKPDGGGYDVEDWTDIGPVVR